MKATKLTQGDTIRVIAPSRSLSLVSKENIVIAEKAFNDLGLNVTYSKNVYEMDDFSSSTIESRISDLHAAFLDKEVKAIFTSIGGFNCNQLLNSINWNIIKDNPKIFCGFSDVTVLNHAIYKMTDLIAYQGPHFSSLGMLKGIDYTISYLKRCLFSNAPYMVIPSHNYSDDKWFLDQETRKFEKHLPIKVIHPGKAQGKIIGGNLCTLNLLQGTKFMPSLKDSILFVEDDNQSDPATLDRDLQSLIHQQGFAGVKAVVFGMFQKNMKLSQKQLVEIVENKKELENLPVVANFDFGHTTPRITFPVGGQAVLENNTLTIIEH